MRGVADGMGRISIVDGGQSQMSEQCTPSVAVATTGQRFRPIADRVAYIDGLRAVAALMVFMVHAGGLLSLGPIGQSIVNHGLYGVTVFFVLSAYTLCMSVAPAFDGHPVSWRAYFIRRFFRIAPLYYVVIVYAACTGPERPDYLLTLFLHLSFANMVVPQYANDILSIEWAIAVEWSFYVMFPVLAILARSRTSLTMLVATAAVVFVTRDRLFSALPLYSSYRQFSVLLHLYAFVGGIAVYAAIRQAAFQTISGRSMLWGFNVLCAAMIAFMIWHGDSAYTGPLVALITGVVILNAQSGGLARSILSWPPLAFIGKISFSVYLLHIFFVGWVHSLEWRPEAAILAALAATLGAATVTYLCIERPGMAAGRLLAQWAATRRQELRPAPTTPA
jgi:exopolysaccharide production protein ExoZ